LASPDEARYLSFFQATNLLAVAALIALGSGLFSAFSPIIACIVKTRERFMSVGQA
jgi:ABC-2 type transport system permease protein